MTHDDDYMSIKENAIFDFETLSTDYVNGVVVSFSVLNYDDKRFLTNPYTYMELVNSASFIKFDVEEQIKKYGRKIDPDTVEWWNNQGEEARKQLKPSVTDESISQLFDHFLLNVDTSNLKKVYTRRNTFDPIFFENVMKTINRDMPYRWWAVRDTISTIEGMALGQNIHDSFIPNKECENLFIKHDPRHDISMDVMRLQALTQAILGED